MVTAFEDTLRELQLINREDPLVERVAKIIIDVRKAGCGSCRHAGLRAERHPRRRVNKQSSLETGTACGLPSGFIGVTGLLRYPLQDVARLAVE